MSFKSGNIVKIINGINGDKSDCQHLGELAVIEYSFGEQFGNGECYGGYSIILMETGHSSAWWNESSLEFVEDGGKHLIVECKNKYQAEIKQVTDLKWIKENFSVDGIHEATMLKLFEEIGYTTPFLRNGEYFILYNDWKTLKPIFEYVFSGNLTDALIYVDSVFNLPYRGFYKSTVTKFYEKLKAI